MSRTGTARVVLRRQGDQRPSERMSKWEPMAEASRKVGISLANVLAHKR
jgi:hypothetical protein